MEIESPPKPMTVDEWLSHEVPEGLHAEMVDGELQMSFLAGPQHQRVLHWLIRQITLFMHAHPGVLAFWSSPCRV